MQALVIPGYTELEIPCGCHWVTHRTVSKRRSSELVYPAPHRYDSTEAGVTLEVAVPDALGKGADEQRFVLVRFEIHDVLRFNWRSLSLQCIVNKSCV